MTAEEALALVEVALDFQRLNKVQELVFRQSWEGRSYIEIAKSSGYETDYIKDAGAKLWRLLSKVLGEKVKKDNVQSVVKRYSRRHQVNLQQNRMIGVNLSGANLSGAILCFSNFNGSDSLPDDLVSEKKVNNNAQTDEEIIDSEEGDDQGEHFNSKKIYHWHGLRFHSDEQIKIAEALDRAGVLFCPNSKVRLTTSEGRENQEPNFLVFHEGKWGILQVEYPEAEENEERDRIFKSHGISIIQHYDATQCSEQPDAVVQEFLEILSQV